LVLIWVEAFLRDLDRRMKDEGEGDVSIRRKKLETGKAKHCRIILLMCFAGILHIQG
jgi:hypothetical protein